MIVTMVDPSLFTGRYDDALCAALAARGHDVTLLGRPLRPTDSMQPESYRYEPRFFRFGERARGWLGEGMLGRALKGADYWRDARDGPLAAFSGQLSHWQWLPLPGADKHWLRRLRGRMALVHTVHNSQPFHGDSALQGRGYAALLRQFDALIVHGAGTKQSLVAQGIAPDMMRIIPMPPMALEAAALEDIASVPLARVPRILFFGTLRPYKGLDLLTSACLSLWREGLAFELVVAGKPFIGTDALFQPIREAGFGDNLGLDLQFLSEPKLDAYLQSADIMVFPYRTIDSSAAFLTGLRYGAAMVTSDAGMFAGLGQGDVAKFPVDDGAALTDILRRLIADEAARSQLGAAALRLRECMGNWNEAAAATEQAYEIAAQRFARRMDAA